jgi:hypothetical protein
MPVERQLHPMEFPKPFGAHMLSQNGTLSPEDLPQLKIDLGKGDYLVWGRAFFGNQDKTAGGFITCSLTATFPETGAQLARDHLRLWVPPNQGSESDGVAGTTSRVPVSLMFGIKAELAFRAQITCEPGNLDSLVASSISIIALPIKNLALNDVGLGSSDGVNDL